VEAAVISTGIVGPILGPIGTRREGQLGTTGWVNGEIGYTYAIGGVPFMIAPGDEHPYQRQTATFRKQQFDAAQNVGEQSLDGFWRRSQLSFHKGAGIRYYDAVTEDEAVNRAWDLDGVDPWTPGQVTLGMGFDELIASAHTRALVGYDGTDVQALWLRAADGKIKKVVGGVTTTVFSGASAAFTADPDPGGRAYYIDGDELKSSDASTIATHATLDWSGVWWAKGRLIAMDEDGRFYSLVSQTASQTPGTADAFWIGTGQTDGWSVADSPGAFFLARGTTVYSATLDAQGEVPELTSPTTAAQLPQGEIIQALGYYLGYLVIVTSAGVRVAATDTSGQVQYGPLLFDWESSNCRTIAAQGERVYVTGKRADDDTERVFCINLAEATADTTFAWAVEKETPDWDGASASGTLFYQGALTVWDGSSFYAATVVEYGEGVIETGFLRFGTMEPKAFHAVRVKLDGTGGNVTVVLVRRGGAELTLASIAAAPNVDADIPLNILTPEEFIGLKFVLSAPDDEHVPILLGYQVTALPAPRRQRMHQVPLLCYDKVQAKNGDMIGYEGRAWVDLQAIERMEATAGEVLAQDFRTGEQFAAFIEEILFINRTPPKSYVSGHGGMLILTLRQV